MTATKLDRKLVEGSLWGTGVLLVLLLVGIVNYFGFRYYHRFDWTKSKVYSLSEKTVTVLQGIQAPIEVTVLLSPDNRELYSLVRELLERYAAKSDKVQLRFVDPARNRAEAARLVEQYQLSNLNVVVFDQGTDRRVVDSSQLAEYDYSGFQFGGAANLESFRGEEAFTRALLELTEKRKPKVLWVTGHGEAGLDEFGNEGANKLRDLVGKENVEFEEWRTLGQSDVPEATELVVIAGPRVAFTTPELEMLDRYLDRGGRLLVMLDPELRGGGADGLVATGLEDWLNRYGVRVGRDLVVDPRSTVPFFGAETLFVSARGGHPVSKALAESGIPVIVQLAQSVTPGTPPAGVEAKALLETSSEGWGERDLKNLRAVVKGSEDTVGPVAMAVAVGPAAKDQKKDLPDELEEEDLEDGTSSSTEATDSGSGPTWRLVAIGDSDFLRNSLLENVGNPILATNLFNWLLERERLLGIGPKRPEQARLSLTPQQLSAITWGTLLGMPAVAAVAGIVVYRRRRR